MKNKLRRAKRALVQRKKQKERSLDRDYRRFREILALLGFPEEPPKLHPVLEKRFYRTNPPITVVVAAELKGNKIAEQIRKESQLKLEKCTLDIPGLSNAFPVQDYFRYLKALSDNLDVVGQSNRMSYFKRVHSVVQPLVDSRIAEASASIHFGLESEVLIHFNRVDDTIFWIQAEPSRNENRKFAIRMILRSAKAQQEKNLFRCGQCYAGHLMWVEWPGSLFGASNAGALPVYICEHAIRQLRERAQFIENGDGYINDWMFLSIRKPNQSEILSAEEGRFLIPFVLFGWKLGYFVFEVFRDKVVIVTFLFLTMDGTPESAKLKAQWKLQKLDKKTLQIDDLKVLLMSDIKNDPNLVKLFEDCGCGHLFKVAKAEVQPVLGYAEDIRKYLQI